MWQVINKTRDGYVLLLSKEALDIKDYGTKNNLNIYKYSKHINFDNFDVDISSDLQVGALKNNDIELPKLTLLNEEVMFERQLGSFDLVVEPSDNIDVDYVLLPNGNKIYSNGVINYTVHENGDYFMEIKDVSGNFRRYMFPIYNINMPSKVDIVSSSNGWTNKDVKVSITTTNENTSSYAEEIITSSRDTFLQEWSNYNSLKGRQIRITGSVELVSYNMPLGNVSTGLGLYYNKISKNESGDFVLSKSITYPKRWKLVELEEEGKQYFDIVATIPNSVNNYFQPFFQTETYNEKAYYIKWADVEFELLDKDNFGIEKIVLPDGREIFESSYEDILRKEGEFIYTVYDSNGVITKKSVRVLIDKEPPILELEYENNTPPKRSSILIIRASDSKSGIQKIVLPNGEEVYKDYVEYNITSNGMLGFKVYDKAGNMSTKNINITNIDNEVTEVKVSKSEEIPTSGSVILKIESKDPSGIRYIELPSQERVYDNNVSYTVNKNGRYKFIICDNLGNEEIVYVDVENIDTDKPIINYVKNENWTNEGVEIVISAEDV